MRFTTILLAAFFLFACPLVTPAAPEDGCEGCTDTSVAPAAPPAVEWWDWFGIDLKGTAAASISVTSFSGECAKMIADPDHPFYGLCFELYPCTPLVNIQIDLDGDILFTTEEWTIIASGTVCNVGHSPASFTAYNDDTITVFNDYVGLGCGLSCSINVDYSIELEEQGPFGNYSWGTQNIHIGGTLSCEMCDLYPN